jgi:hypothetical protein
MLLLGVAPRRQDSLSQLLGTQRLVYGFLLNYLRNRYDFADGILQVLKEIRFVTSPAYVDVDWLAHVKAFQV